MFYDSPPDNALRFGDVLYGFVLAAPAIEKPFPLSGPESYKITVSHPRFCVMLTPCCSIKDKIVTLAPLELLNRSYFENPFFVEDFTRINREIPAEKSVPPSVWETMPLKTKERKLDPKNRESFALLDQFVYAPSSVLPSYELRLKGGTRQVVRHYQISFRKLFHVRCDSVLKPDKAPLDSKLLQLARSSREQLREKLTYFFGRVPNEDLL